jgi:hypothetical protein
MSKYAQGEFEGGAEVMEEAAERLILRHLQNHVTGDNTLKKNAVDKVRKELGEQIVPTAREVRDNPMGPAGFELATIVFAYRILSNAKQRAQFLARRLGPRATHGR